MEPMEPDQSNEPPTHPPLQTALLLIGVLVLLVGLAAYSTFS